MRKDEAIERTFKGVAKHFRDVFSELVPGEGLPVVRGLVMSSLHSTVLFMRCYHPSLAGGRGELVMQKRLPGVVGGAAAEVDGEDEGAGGAHEGGTLEKYSGVKVRDRHCVDLDRHYFLPLVTCYPILIPLLISSQVRISFTRGGETMSLKQLSGGQRTLVALALIFAIQVRIKMSFRLTFNSKISSMDHSHSLHP